MVAAAVIGGAAVGAVASSASSKSAANKQKDASNAAVAASQDATNQSLDFSKQQYADSQARTQPFYDITLQGANKLSDLLGLSSNTGAAGYGSLGPQTTAPNFSFDSSKIASDPGYQFQLQQGQNALDRKAAAGGGFYSGAGLQAASKFNQGLASTALTDAYNRQKDQFQTNFNTGQVQRQNSLAPLQSLLGQGQTATQQLNSSGQGLASTQAGLLTGNANALGQIYTNNANAQGAAGIAGANAIGGSINSGISSWQQANLLSKVFGQQPVTNYNAGYNGGGSNGYYDVTNASSPIAQNGSDVGWYASDRRLKTDIEQIGETSGGVPVYRFRYLSGGPEQVGVMAQDMMLVDPSAVRDRGDGFLEVNYSKVAP
jgi:hypothetical protein